jgi:hypothetical protein
VRASRPLAGADESEVRDALQQPDMTHLEGYNLMPFFKGHAVSSRAVCPRAALRSISHVQVADGVRFGSWLRENSEIEFANGNFVSTSIDLKNKSAGDGCRDKTIENNSACFSCAHVFTQPGSIASVL